MTHDEATKLAVRISQIWPRGGLSTEVWETELRQYTFGRARDALAMLKTTEERAPTIARFVSAYGATGGPSLLVECTTCDGGGWVEVTDERRHGQHCLEPGDRSSYGEPGDCNCRAVEPCPHCAAGEAMKEPHLRLTNRSHTRYVSL